MKVNENGTLLKVKCLILLNIFSVFPTHVGMFPNLRLHVQRAESLPHACGDVPEKTITEITLRLSSPRMWGCSYHPLKVRLKNFVFPTHVGMFRILVLLMSSCLRLPHACGDVPVPVTCPMMMSSVSSPRMWGFPKKQKFLFLLAYRKCLLYKCFHRTDTCRFSFKSFVCLCRPSSSVLDRVWEC